MTGTILDDLTDADWAAVERLSDHVTWDPMAYHLQERGLVDYGAERAYGSRPGLTPLGHAVARRLGGDETSGEVPDER